MRRIVTGGIIIGVVLASAFASYRYGISEAQNAEIHSRAYIQTTLAFAQYKAHERIESLLVRKCYDAAVAETRQLRNEQLYLVADHLRRSGNDADLVAYMKDRDPKLTEIALKGQIPELKPLATTCP